MERAEFVRRVKFISKFGRVLHSVGSPAHTLESTTKELCALFGIKGSVVSLPTAIFSSFIYNDEEITKIDRVDPQGVNLSKLSKVDMIAREVIEGQTSYEDGALKLDEVLGEADSYGKLMRVISFVLSAGGFMVLFGGNWGDLAASMIIGLLVGLLSLLRPIGVVAQLLETPAAIIASLGTYLLAKLVPGLNIAIIILSGLIIFMPGLYITIAIAEIATQNLTSGTSRLMGGVMILLKLTFGVFVGSKIASWFHYAPLDISLSQIPAWLIIFTLPITAFMSTFIFKALPQDWKWVTFAGVFGYCCSRIGTYYMGPELGIFFGGACVGSMANVFARFRNRPSSIFQFPGIILLVPGSVGYRSFSSLFERDVVGGLDMAFTMVILAMALVVGVFIGNMFIRPRLSL